MANDLVARICADPANPSLRLVYADRLTEAGDPRGIFIAHQCALEQLDPLDERYARTLASARRLEAEHAASWLRGYLERTRVEGASLNAVLSPVFKNGFLQRLAIEPGDVAAQWPWLSAREPIEGIELRVNEGLPAECRDMPVARHFKVLKVSPEGWFTSNSVATVLAWGLPLVRELDLSRCDLGSTGAQLLANLETDLGRHFPDFKAPPPFAAGQLTRLVLQGCGIGDDGARMLFAAKHLAGLEELDLGGCGLREPGSLKALRGSVPLRSLRRFSLAGNNKLAGHLDALAGWDVLPKLEQLALPQVVTAKELTALFPRPSKQLRELDLRTSKGLFKTPEVLLQLAEALTSLDLGGTSVGDAGWRQLVDSNCLQPVMHLFANGCSLSDDGIEALTQSKLRRVVSLDVSSNKLTDDGFAALAAWPGLETVTDLRLGNNRKVTADGYAALIAAPGFAPAALDVGKLSDKKLVKSLRERFGAAVQAGS